MAGSEGKESESPTHDPHVLAGSVGGSTGRPVGVQSLMDDFTTHLNNALAKEHFQDASVIQHLMMGLLDLTYQNEVHDPARRR